MDLQGFIELDAGGLVMVDYRGYGRVHRNGHREIGGARWWFREVVGAAWHITDVEPYRHLNDTICVISGEVRGPDKEDLQQAEVQLVFQVAELVWSPAPD